MKAETAVRPSGRKLKYGHRAIPGFLLLALIAALFTPSFLSLIAQWQGHYSQGGLIALLAVGLVWRDRGRLALVPVKSVPLGVLALVGLGVLWKFAQLLSVETAANYLLFLTAVTGIWALYGGSFMKALAFPLALFFLALPLHEPPVTWLQDITAGLSVLLLHAVGVPVVWEGYMLHIPAGDFVVAETCAGWRFLEATFPLALLYAYFTYSSLKRRALFMAAALVVAVLANSVRAAGVVTLGHFFGIEAEIVQDHYSWGWFVYFFAMLILFSVGRRWSENRKPNLETPGAGSESRVDYRVAALAVLSLCAAALIPFREAVQTDGGQLTLSTPYNELGPGANWRPSLSGIAEEVETRLAIEGSVVDIYMGAFLVGSGNDYTSGSQRMVNAPWQPIAEHPVGSDVPLQELIIEGYGMRRIVWYGYCAEGGCVGSRFEAKGLEAKALLNGAPYVGVVALSTLTGLQADTARADLHRAWESLEIGL